MWSSESGVPYFEFFSLSAKKLRARRDTNTEPAKTPVKSFNVGYNTTIVILRTVWRGDLFYDERNGPPDRIRADVESASTCVRNKESVTRRMLTITTHGLAT